MPKLQIARACPHTRKANGVILMPAEILAALTGAVRDPDEWAIVLQGIKSEDNYEITVTGWRLPEQERTGGHVDLSKDIIQTPISNPPGNDVAVLHSHCNFGASFSQLDIDKLNTRYPASIVISQSKTSLLGFDYSAVGKVTLPCGGRGEIKFLIQPMAEIELAAVNRVTHNEADLGDCTRYHNVAEDQWKVQWKGDCGLLETAVAPKPAAFGVSDDLLDVVAKLPREKVVVGFQQNLQNVYPQRKLAVGWKCPKDGSELYWSIAREGQMHCDKCQGYFVEPGKETTTTITVESDNEINDADMTYCESCEDFVTDKDWGCAVCEARYCNDCDTYHDGYCFGHGSMLGLVWM